MTVFPKKECYIAKIYAAFWCLFTTFYGKCEVCV